MSEQVNPDSQIGYQPPEIGRAFPGFYHILDGLKAAQHYYEQNEGAKATSCLQEIRRGADMALRHLGVPSPDPESKRQERNRRIEAAIKRGDEVRQLLREAMK